MADFTLTVGTHKSLVPSAKDVDGNSVAFPVGSVFNWELSDPSASIDDPSSPSPVLTGVATSDPANSLVITMTVSESGFTHSASHTVDVVAAPVDVIASVDFTLN